MLRKYVRTNNNKNLHSKIKKIIKLKLQGICLLIEHFIWNFNLKYQLVKNFKQNL